MRQPKRYAVTYADMSALIEWALSARPQSTDVVVLTSAGLATKGVKADDDTIATQGPKGPGQIAPLGLAKHGGVQDSYLHGRTGYRYVINNR